jgi:serine/threonine protein kinase
MPVEIGQTISHYRILKKIGSGGMATVFKAEDINLKRAVALKFLPPLMTANNETRKRFVNEAKSASLLDHPNICTIFEINSTDADELFIAMAYYKGDTLDKMIRKSPLELQQSTNITIQIAEGLAKAHEKGIIHRDIKPANIMVTNDGIVKILDFGLAKLSDHTALTQTGTMLGTVNYMSPEQAGGEKVDQRSDIWSLGVLVYEMLNGYPPFKGDNEQATVYAILKKDPQPLTNVPEYIEKIIHKSLVKDINNRYQDIRELIKDLKAKSTPDINLPIRENSIVVLPFSDYSSNKENEYFSDGLTEEIITDLSKVHNLLVISRGSAMTYKDTVKKVKEIGKELNVRYALEGSVRKSGNDLRINAQLIDTQNDTHIWAEKYSGTLDDIFDIQDKVSRSIVDALQLKLTPQEDKKLAKRPIKNIHAYDCYMRARQESWLFTPDALERAIGYLQNGLEIIGENALLYAGMAYVYDQCVNIGLDIETNIANTRKYAEKALALDPDSAEAHIALGHLSQILGDDLRGVTHLKKALTINPGDIHATIWLCVSLGNTGKISEMRSLVENLRQIDPLTPMTRAAIGIVPLYEGNGKEAVEGVYDWFHLEPQNPGSVYFYTLSLVYAGRYQEAIEIINKNIHFDWQDTFTKLSLLVKYCVKKDIKKIEELVSGEFENTLRRDTQSTYFASALFAYAGMTNKALEFLEQAIENGFINYPLIAEKDPLLENVRGTEQFKKLIKRVKHEWENFDA